MITENKIKGLKSKEKRYFLAVGENLLICVSPNGKKSFFVDFKDNLTQKRKRTKIGEFPKMSLKNAREKIDEFLEKNDEKSIDFLTAWNEFFNAKIKATSQSNQTSINRFFEKLFKPNFEELNLKRITRVEILNAIQPHIVNKQFESARRALNAIRAFFNYCTTYGYANENPALKIELSAIIKRPESRHFATITEPQEIAKLLRNICEYNGNLLTKICAITQILTALRSLNARSLKWSQIDLKTGVINFEAQKMKNRTAFNITSSAQLLTLLKKIKALNFKSEFVFFSPKTNARPLSENAVRAALRNMGYENEQITPHGFRAMFSTIANENNKDAEIIELCLAHTDKNQIRATYNHAKKEAQKAELWQWWADYLQNLYDYTKILI